MDKKIHLKWLEQLYASGYAGVLKSGEIVDRRNFPKAHKLQQNDLFGIAKPKKLPK